MVKVEGTDNQWKVWNVRWLLVLKVFSFLKNLLKTQTKIVLNCSYIPCYFSSYYGFITVPFQTLIQVCINSKKQPWGFMHFLDIFRYFFHKKIINACLFRMKCYQKSNAALKFYMKALIFLVSKLVMQSTILSM